MEEEYEAHYNGERDQESLTRAHHEILEIKPMLAQV
jgi:hypothetical protein